MKSDKVGAVLVVGGGIAGMQAALDLADAGFKVYLVEETTAIGGRMAQLDKTFPTNDCSICTISPRLIEVGKHLNIEILTNTEILGAEGETGDFTVEVLRHPRYVDEVKCNACGDCVEKCPVEMASEFDEGLTVFKAIHKRYPQAIPNAFAIKKEGISPCRAACPAGIRVQGYVALASQGKFKEALDVIRDTLPFPSVCGRVCHHPCETECGRKEIDEPVAIRGLKRFLADRAREEGEEPPEKIEPTKEEKVAVVGAGPAGLTCALRLLQKGYPATVLEASDKPGGMLTATLPDYRLPGEAVEHDIDRVLATGIELKTGIRIGKDISFEDLRKEYNAVFIAIGSQNSAKLGIEPEGVSGVLLGLDFLRAAKRGDKIKGLGKKVVVIGGGNVAIDCAKTALRLGAQDVQLVCLETCDLTSRDRMPAHDWEIEEALEEGVKINGLLGPREILTSDDKVTGLATKVCTRVYDDEGRFAPEFSGEEGPTFEADTVIIAIGQRPDVTGFDELDKTRGGIIKVDSLTLETNIPGVFAGGDIARGPASVIEAVAHGNEAAISIERYLEGKDLREGREEQPQIAQTPEGQHEKLARTDLVKRSPAERVKGFTEVEQGFDEETAIAQAQRCLNCAVCSECLQCVVACEAQAIDHGMKPEKLSLSVGAIILTPGIDCFAAAAKPQYGYGRFKNVVTGLEFERILSASGPFQGELVRPSDKTHPKKIAWVQCVGSRDIGAGNEYCSSVCCMYATKEAIIAKEHATEEIESHIYFMDMRCFGKDFDRYYERAMSDYGVEYRRAGIAGIEELPETDRLKVKYESEDGKLLSDEYDMVVLSTGLTVPERTRELAKRLSVGLDRYGFCETNEFSPNQTTRPGIFAAGAFEAPMDIPESVVSASSASALSTSLLAEARGTLVRKKEYPPEIDVSGEEPRVGVFICRCGANIARVVDVPSVVSATAKMRHVVHVEENLYTCSTDTQLKIIETIKEKNLNRVVVASCTPRTHEPLFQDTLRDAGLNKFLFEMANIRDQCSWVHAGAPEAATRKAVDLVRMAVARAATLEPLQEIAVDVIRRGLVLGGGVAGMTAALSLASQGFESYLIEKQDRLGGNLASLRGTLEGGDPAALLQDLLARVENESLLTVYKNAEVVDFSGHVGRYKSKILTGGKEVELEHGTIIVATGGVEYKPEEYLYARNDKVLTQLELENMLQNPQSLKDVKEVVMIQCVGSREEPNLYCSRICCTEAVKNALALKEINPETDVYILYRDMRTYGLSEIYYRKAREAGVQFVRFERERKPQVSVQGDHLQVKVLDPVLGLTLRLEPDMLVLSSAIRAQPDSESLATRMKISRTGDGFFLEAHMKLRPLDFANDGMYMCGFAHSPKSTRETIQQAQGAAARAATILSKEKLSVGGIVSVVNQDNCAACLTCVRVCPYQVPAITESGAAEIAVESCHGCGICASACPRKAIELQHYKDAQIVAKCLVL